MKKIFLVAVIGILVTGCNLNTKTNPTEKENPTKNEEVKKEIRIDEKDIKTSHPETTAAEGEICGGVEKELCRQGLSCVFDYDTEDGHGTCAPKVVKEKDCSEEAFGMVCGLNDGRQKYNYFNQCQLERHGAELINKGKCKFDETVYENCEAQVRGFSNCFETTVGYEFDGKKCVKKVVASCGDPEIPFTSLENCEAKCL